MTGRLTLLALVLIAAVERTARADEFTYIDESKQEQRVDARLAGSGQGFFALELADGSWRLVPEAAVSRRQPGPDPEPITPPELGAQLESRFTAELFRYKAEGPFLVGLVLQAPLPAETDTKVEGFLDKAIKFYQSIDRMFTRFGEQMKLELQPSRFPLTMIIFETDELFEQYADEATGGRGLSSQNIAGFYSALTNELVLRLDECDSFAVPLHEAIHQQVFNRGVFQRLAPVPVWFNEGIATGFENDGTAIRANPQQINRTFAGLAQRPLGLSYDAIIAADESFQGDVTAGDAYVLAWCLHWQLVTAYPAEYTAYIQQLGRLEPLQPRGDDRAHEFQTAFGRSPAQMTSTFADLLRAQARRERVKLEPPQIAVGNLVTQDNTGLVEIGLVRRGDLGGRLQCIGKLKNLSPFRTLSFRVALVPPGGGQTIEWTMPDVAPNRTVNLERQLIAGPTSDAFQVVIESSLTGN